MRIILSSKIKLLLNIHINLYSDLKMKHGRDCVQMHFSLRPQFCTYCYKHVSVLQTLMIIRQRNYWSVYTFPYLLLCNAFVLKLEFRSC